MNKSLIIFMVLSSLLLSGITFAAYDITSPGDPLKGIPDDGDWPAGEAPPFVIDDNINTKFLHFKGDEQITGFQVTPSHNGVVTGLSFTTANDAPERDPVSFQLYGSNATIDGPYTLIASGDILDFSQPAPWPRLTKNETAISFSNTEVYTHYQVLFTALRVPANGCCMQVAEVELLVETPPTAWAYKDIGTTGGHAWEEPPGTYNVRADGADIWDVADQFGYVYRPVSGDIELEVRLDGMTTPPPSDWTKVGVMIRESTAPGSKHAAIALTGNNGWQFLYRSATNGTSAAPGTMSPYGFPEKMMIQRIKDFEPGIDKFVGYFYLIVWPGVIENWTALGDVNMPAMPDDVLVGLAVTSHTSGQLCYAQYGDVNWPAVPYEKPWDMIPVNGTVDVLADSTMTWRPGDSAVSHDVYLGTDPGALALVATKALGDESYTPAPPLMEGVTYYWQVVEQPLGQAGPIMSFTTYLPPPPPAGIQRCYWGGIGGTNIDDLRNDPRYPDNPEWCDQLTSMAAYDFADNYGQRMQGLLWPVTGGDYTFWIAGDDSIELWLSTDDNPDNLVKIAEHVGWTNAHQWFDAPEQQSAPIPLVGGQKYWIRAFHKEGGGGDNCQVGWFGPDQPVWPWQGATHCIITDYYFPPLSLEPIPLWPPAGPVTLLEAEDDISWKEIRGATYNVYFGEDGGSMALIYSGAGTSVAPPPVEIGKTYSWKVDYVYDTLVVEGPVRTFTVQDWVSIDIGREGNPDPAGSSSYDESSGVYTVKAGGSELWGNNDQFHYLYTTMKMTRDEGMIQARVLGIDVPDSWRRAGVQIRESRADNAAKVMAHKTGHDNTRMQFRDYTGTGTGNTADNWGLGFPRWVRVTRNGNLFNGYRSPDGVNWTHLGSRSVTMTKDYVCVGLAVCHHPSQPQDQLTTGTFDNLSISTPDPFASWAPNPGDGADNVPMVDVTLRWNAGQDAEEHLLYFSDNYGDVLYGLVEPVVLPAGTTEYNVGKLDLTKVYYWAVDEVRREGREMLTALGDIWSFKVENFRLIDDFEQYCITPEPIPPQEAIPGEVLVEAVPPPDQYEIVAGYTIPGYTIEAVPPDAGCLIAEWAFEGNFDDTSGSGFNGTPMGDATIVTDAERGNVLSLDGDGDYVDCGNPAALNFGTNDWSLSAWVKTTITGTSDAEKGALIANGGDGGGGHRYCLIVSEQQEGEVTLVIDDNKADGIGSSYDKKQARGDITKVNDDVWHHVLGVREGDQIRIYIDGVEEGSTGIGGVDYDLQGTVQANVLLGAVTKFSDSSIYKTLAGLLDDAQIYNCALTEGNARYMAGVGDLVIPDVVVPPVYGPLLIHYAFDDGAGDVATDSSGNNNHGAISNAAWTAVTADGSAACLDFEGGSNVVNNDIGYLMNGLNAMTISLWIQSDDVDTDQGFLIFANPAGNDERGMRYDKSGANGGGVNVIKYGVTTDVASEQSESSQNVQTTSWQHILITWDSSVGTKLYINGIEDIPSDDDTDTGGVLTAYNKIIVGKGGKDSASDASWDGRIDDVRIYNYVVTEGERRYLAGIGDLLKPPTYEPLVAHYEFEGNYDDSSGNNRTATPIGDGVTIETDPIMGQVLSLPGGTNEEPSRFVEVGSVGISGNDQTTIACWAKADHTSIPDWTLVFGFTGTATGDGGNGSHFNIGSLGGPGGVGAHCWGWEETIFSDQEALDWHHYAMTYDGTTILYYGDGSPKDTDPGKSNVRDLSIRGDRVHIGSRVTQNSSFPGKVDDARVYNIALTPEQISGIAGCDNPIENSWQPLGPASVSLDYLDSHMGVKSMRIEGNQTVKAQHKTIFRDWASGGAKALVMYFKGHPDNEVIDMSVLLQTDTGASLTLPYEGDLADLMSEEWTEWNIDLSDVVGNVVWMAVGFHGSGVIRIDDIRLYPPRCVPALSSATDLNQDCVVNGKDLRLLLGKWLFEAAVQDWEYRAAYYDARYPTGWAHTTVAEGVRDYFSAAGYTVLDADQLKTWMDDRIADGALSVVVMCQDIAPDTVAETRDASCTLRRYLDAGGKVVQYADIPFYNQGHADGTTTNWATDGSLYILGFNAAGAGWDSWNTVSITAAGANWGLTTPWPSLRPALSYQVDTILASDDDGDASGWAKHYLPYDHYRGFVYIADFNPDDSVIPLLGPALLSVAEYNGTPMLYDLYEDDAINFKDYSVLMLDWLEEITFP